MKLLNDVLYLEFSELIDCGVKEEYLKKAKSVGTKCWEFINDPADKRKVLIGYEKLKDQYKEKVQRRFGNPYDYIAKQPIKQLVQKDFKAETFYMQYRFEGDKHLAIDHVNKYTTAANWLNMLLKADADKQFIKKSLGLYIDKFYLHVGELIKTDNIDLPTSYHRLRAKMDEYKADGYSCLIHKHFGNKLAAKLGKTDDGFSAEVLMQQTALIRSAASKHNNFDCGQIARAVNIVFEKHGWPTVSHGTVYNVIKANEHIVTPGRRGTREFNNTMAMQTKRSRPTVPLHYFTLDGWTVELLYQENGRYDNRLVVVVVLDAMNNYPIGYAIGDRESASLIRQANRNAIIHIQQLFGHPYRPHQIQSDHYAIKQLTPFYESMAKLHTPAAVGNAKSKVIEPYFNYLNKTYCQVQYNWSGHNVTASRANQPNAEMLDKIKHSFPGKDEVMNVIHAAMMQERKIKIDAYRQAWQLVNDDDKLVLDKMDWLMIFGTPTGYINSITGEGLTPTILGEKRYYDSFNGQWRNLQHLKWNVIYDADDLQNVLAISEDNKHRFVLHEKRFIPMAVADQDGADNLYLSETRSFNKQRREEIISTYANDAALVEELISNTPLALNDFQEASLKLMFTHNGQQKEKLQDAKGLKQLHKAETKAVQQQSDNWGALQQDYLKNKIDFNQFLD